MSFGLDGKNVVVTGGDGALGQAVVHAFRDAGAVCHLPLFGPPPGESVAGLRMSGPVNLTDEAAVVAYYAALPPLTASVHLAGGFQAKPIAETSRADLLQQLDLNLVTAFLCCREAVKALRQSGGGRIVNVGSRAVELPAKDQVAYAISKSGVGALTRALAVEMRDEGILVNAVLPSIIDTPANRAAMPKANHDRWPKAEEIARTIVWLVSDENRLTSGALIPVYGRG